MPSDHTSSHSEPASSMRSSSDDDSMPMQKGSASDPSSRKHSLFDLGSECSDASLSPPASIDAASKRSTSSLLKTATHDGSLLSAIKITSPARVAGAVAALPLPDTSPAHSRTLNKTNGSGKRRLLC